MTTKKDHLTKGYLNFIEEVKKIIDVDIFPNLEDVDITDVLLFFNISFMGCDDYEDIIRGLIMINGVEISDEKFKILLPITTKYINDLKLFLKTN